MSPLISAVSISANIKVFCKMVRVVCRGQSRTKGWDCWRSFKWLTHIDWGSGVILLVHVVPVGGRSRAADALVFFS